MNLFFGLMKCLWIASTCFLIWVLVFKVVDKVAPKETKVDYNVQEAYPRPKDPEPNWQLDTLDNFRKIADANQKYLNDLEIAKRNEDKRDTTAVAKAEDCMYKIKSLCD
jgi:hypothetical protein